MSQKPSSSNEVISWRIAGGVLIALVAFVAYYPSLNGGFIFDDHVLLTNSPAIKAANGFWRVWITTEQPDYVPLTSTTLWFEWRLWGTDPRGYHVVNLLLHVAACVVLWQVLRKLLIPGAFLAALLYAIHPVNVESVAWIVQRKDTLSTLFFLLAILGYVRSDFDSTSQPAPPAYRLYRAGAGYVYWLGLVASALAMFSKGSVATLPLVLLLIAWWQHGRVTMRDLVRSVPFFLVSAILTPVVMWFVAHGTGATVRDVTLVQRVLQAGTVVWFYLSKALAPIKLIFFYPMWNIHADNLLWWLPLIAALTLTVVLLVQRNSRHAIWLRPLLFAWAFFCVTLAPAMGFFDPGYMKFSLVADHYQHLALLAVVSLMAAAISVWRQRIRTELQPAVVLAAVVIVGGFTFLSWQQARLYDTDIHLYEVTLQDNPKSWLAHTNLGSSLLTVGRTSEAIEHLNEALRLAPDTAESHHDLANALAEAGRPQEAIPHYQQALKLRPDFVKSQCNLGSCLMIIGQVDEAIRQFEQALEIDPNYAEAHFCLANALSRTGRPDEALQQYRLAVECNPNYAEAQNTLGSRLIQLGQIAPAMEHFRQALHSNPKYAEAHNNLAIALASTGHMPEAIEHFQKAVELEPRKGDTHYNLGVVLFNVGRAPEAVDQLVEALRLDPNRLQAYAKLATAYAQLQRPAEAIAMAEKGLEVARSSGQTQLATQFEGWLTRYRAQQGNPSNPSPPSGVAPASPSR